MHREGHIGAALLCYAPVGLVLAVLVSVSVGVVGAVVAVGLSTLPDVDHRLPLVEHRGITHTVHFALLVGLLTGAGGVLLGAQHGPLAAVVLGVAGFVVGAVTICSHVLADALTPMGVDPFRRGEHLSYEVTTAKNPVANVLLLGLGVGVCLLAAWIATSLPQP